MNAQISNVCLYPDQISALTSSAKGIYLLIDADENVLYVGKSTNLQQRLKQHFTGVANTKEFSNYFKKCAVFFVEDKEMLLSLERFLITHFKPELNTQFVSQEGEDE